MRPERADIAVPVFPGRIDWLNADRPPSAEALTATGPLLVHFFDFAQLNSRRALPYVIAWRERYERHGLAVLGIHSPRFGFTSRALAGGLAALGVEHPVADDSGYGIWHDYGCRGWPSLFLWGRGGALRWFHFGEGEYAATEEAIAEELRADDITVQLSPPVEPLRDTDAPGALVVAPSDEVFPGGSPAQPWSAAGGGEIELEYAAGGAWAVAEGEGELRWALDDGATESAPVGPGALQRLAEHPRHERHRLRIEADPGVQIWAISYEPSLA